MRKNYFVVSALLVSGALSAQFTLSRALNTPKIGDSFDYHLSQGFSYQPGNGGANQTWDLSGVSGTPTTIQYIDPANANQPSSFPNATIVEKIGPSENYLSINAGELNYEGHYVSGVLRLVYSDKREMVKFPMTYGDQFSETFAGPVENLGSSQVFQRSGTIEIMADGYGNLILPYGTVSNVLRVKAVFDYSDTYMGAPFFSYVDTICLWYNPGTQNYIANTTVSYANGMKMTSTASYIDQSDLSTSGVGIDESVVLEQVLELYPNPASDQVWISNRSTENLNIEIFDLSGALLQSETINSGKNSLNTSNLEPGVYLLKYLQGKQTYTQRLVIE